MNGHLRLFNSFVVTFVEYLLYARLYVNFTFVISFNPGVHILILQMRELRLGKSKSLSRARASQT